MSTCYQLIESYSLPYSPGNRCCTCWLYHTDFEDGIKPSWLSAGGSGIGWFAAGGKLMSNGTDPLWWTGPIPNDPNISGLGFITSFTVEGDGAVRISGKSISFQRQSWYEIEGNSLFSFDTLNGRAFIASVSQPAKIEWYTNNWGYQLKINGNFYIKDGRNKIAHQVAMRTGSFVSVDDYGVWVEPVGATEFRGGGGLFNPQPISAVSKPFCDRERNGFWPYGLVDQIQVNIPAEGWTLATPPPAGCSAVVGKRTGSFVLDIESEDNTGLVYSLDGDFGYGATKFRAELKDSPGVGGFVSRVYFTWPGNDNSFVLAQGIKTGHAITDDLDLFTAPQPFTSSGIVSGSGIGGQFCAQARIVGPPPDYESIWIITPLP